MDKHTLWITRTAMLVALLVVTQIVTSSLGNQLITGTCVNLILIVSVMYAGRATGAAVALISPACAKLVGIGPFWTLIPFIMAGNLALVLCWFLIARRHEKKFYVIALIAAAASKFLVLYIGIARIAVPLILQLPEPQASVVANTFSIPQIFTALAGGAIAIMIAPVLDRALKSSGT